MFLKAKEQEPFSPLVLELLVVAAHKVGTDVGLEERDDLGETLVTHVLELTEHTGAEEDFGVAETVLVGVQSQGAQHLLCDHLAVNEALGHGVGGQDGVSGGMR